MSAQDIRRAEQTLHALADAFGRPSPVVAQFERDFFHPELWDQLERIEAKKHELASSARLLAAHGANQDDVRAILAAADRCEREEDRLFIRAYWEDMGAAG
jgi:cytochrome c556